MLNKLLTKFLNWVRKKSDERSVPDMTSDAPDTDQDTMREVTPEQDQITTVGKLTIKF